MKLLYPITFKFGELGVEKITENDKEFYYFIASCVLNTTRINWANSKRKELNDLFVTTPIFKKTIQESPNHISKLFIDWCLETAKVVKYGQGKIEDNKTVLLINIQGKGRHKQIGHLASTLETILVNEDSLRIILLVNNLPSDNDIQFAVLMPYVLAKSICIIDKGGNIYKDNVKGKIDKVRFFEFNQKRVPLSYSLIKTKIIKRIGHFKIKPHDEVCNRYFYDGTLCEGDLKELILDFIFQNYHKESQLEYIVYSAELSPWLEKALSGVSADIKNDYIEELSGFKKILNINDLEGKNKSFDYSNGDLLLVVDFVNTGKTLLDSIETIFTKFNVGNNINKLKIISILNKSTNENIITNNIRKIEFDGKEFAFTYFVDVTTLSLDSKTDCDYCRIGIQSISPLINKDDSNKLKSIDFWFLSDSGGYKSEDNVPVVPSREPLELVPKFENWLIENSTYLAFKFKTFIHEYKLANGIDFILVFPLEKETNKSCAYLFATKLKELFNIEIIGIPREFIDEVKKDAKSTHDILAVEDKWAKNIRGKTKKINFIIFDEFHNKGGTFFGIRKILNTMGNPPKSYFILADFNPEKSSTYVNSETNFQVYSFYEFNYN